MTISGVISILIVPENIWYWKVCFVRPKFDKKRIQAEPSFFLVSLASRSNFFLAPKVGIPISFNSSSVSVANVGRSISWRTKISAYLYNPVKGAPTIIRQKFRKTKNWAHSSVLQALTLKAPDWRGELEDHHLRTSRHWLHGPL